MIDYEGGIATNNRRLSKPIDCIHNHNKLFEIASANVFKLYRFLDHLYTMGMILKAIFVLKKMHSCLKPEAPEHAPSRPSSESGVAERQLSCHAIAGDGDGDVGVGDSDFQHFSWAQEAVADEDDHLGLGFDLG